MKTNRASSSSASAGAPNVHMEPVYAGSLGKTLRSDLLVTGQTGQTFTVSAFTQANVTTDPDLRPLLQEGSITSVTDPHTGARYPLALPVVYHNEALRLFALYLPDSLRHQELAQRQDLLARLQADGGELPAYARNFKVAFGHAELLRLEEQAKIALGGDHKEPEQVTLKRLELEEREKKLLEEKQRIEAARLNLESLQTRLQEKEEALRNGRVVPRDHEPTTVVPREVIYQTAQAVQSAKKEPKSSPWGAKTASGWDLNEAPKPPPAPPAAPSRSSAAHVAVTDDLPRMFNRLKGGSRPYYYDQIHGELILSYKLDAQRTRAFVDGTNELFFQLHDLEEFPLVTILVATQNKDGETTDDLYWPLDIRKPNVRTMLQSLIQSFKLRVALYGDDRKLRHVLAFERPLEVNARHVLQLAEQRLKEGQGLVFEDALKRIEAKDYERLGSMKHNFTEDSFQDLKSPAQARLAAGIVGYWSEADTFGYLIENRSFSLVWFDRIQKRVIDAALKYGVSLPEELRLLAVDFGHAPDEAALLKNLVATWVQTVSGAGTAANDMDDLDTWHNWQDLIEASEHLGNQIDDEISKLADAALKRARAFGEANQIPVDALPEEEEGEDPPTLDRGQIVSGIHQSLSPSAPGQIPEVPGKQKLAGKKNQELLGLLANEKDRLPAACLLVEKGGKNDVLKVLESTEEMSDEEIETLSEYLSLYAPKQEEACIEALGNDDPAVDYLCAFALVSIPSARGLDRILSLVKEGKVEGEIIMEALFAFGDLLPDALVKHLNQLAPTENNNPLIEILLAYGDFMGDEALQELVSRSPALKSFL